MIHWCLRVASFLAATLTWVYAAFIAAWLVARLIWGDQLWPVAVLNSFPALLFLPVPLMLALAALSRRRAAWAAALVPLVLWAGLFGWRFLPRVAGVHGADLAQAGGDRLRVMAFNVLTGNGRVGDLVDVVHATQPDLIAFAELSPWIDRELAQQLAAGYPYRTRQDLPGAGYGMAIYSRWPLDDLGSLQTGLGLRSAVADVHTPRGTVRFVALHPSSTQSPGRYSAASLLGLRSAARSIKWSFQERGKQLAAVCDQLDQWGDRPVILAGDFNMTEFSDAYRCINHRLHDGYRIAGRGLGNTWPNGHSHYWPLSLVSRSPALTRIDYVFYSDHWTALGAVVPGEATGSDHRPVVVTLEWTADK
jgi:endonuclease/exonuclease/phosphatase (EEP) superfamily protein YafD